MAIRTDVTVDWNASPRIITVAAPSTEITIQDLHDTCRYFEDSAVGMTEPYLIDSAGKEALGGGVLVGITSTLQNARVTFAGRVGPTWTICVITRGNLTAIDANGDPMDEFEPAAYVNIRVEKSTSAALIQSDEVTAIAGDVESMREFQQGRMKLDSVTKQWIFYGRDNVTELERYDTTDSAGAPSVTEIFERVRTGVTTTTTTTTTTSTTTTTTT